MEKKKTDAKKIVNIIFISLMALTAAAAVAYVVIDDYVRILYDMGERTGFEGLFYFAVVVMAVYAVAVEANLWFDVRYFASGKEIRRKYKTVFHILGIALVALISACAIVLVIVNNHVLSVATVVLAIALGVTRLAHFIVYLIALIKEDKKISKEIDTQ